MKKKGSLEDVLYFVSLKPRRWTEIKKRFNLSDGSMSNYINYLLKKGWVRKQIMDNKVVYFRTWKITSKDLNRIKKRILTTIKNTEHLKEKGLFSKGIDDKEILEYLKTRNDLLDHEKNLIKNSDVLTFPILMIFFTRLTRLPEFDFVVKTNIKIDEDANRLIELLKTSLKCGMNGI